jgi:hypothetical protein
MMNDILEELRSSEMFLFVGSESWGRRPDVIAGKMALRGSITLSQEIATDRLFEIYFRELNVTSAESPAVKVNPWLPKFWETKMNCFLDKSFM